MNAHKPFENLLGLAKDIEAAVEALEQSAMLDRAIQEKRALHAGLMESCTKAAADAEIVRTSLARERDECLAACEATELDCAHACVVRRERAAADIERAISESVHRVAQAKIEMAALEEQRDTLRTQVADLETSVERLQDVAAGLRQRLAAV